MKIFILFVYFLVRLGSLSHDEGDLISSDSGEKSSDLVQFLSYFKLRLKKHLYHLVAVSFVLIYSINNLGSYL